MQALALVAAIRTGCKAWSSRAAATRFGYVLHAFHQLLALILLSSAFLPDVATRLRSAPSLLFADALHADCDHTSHRLRTLLLPVVTTLLTECGHSAQICTEPSRFRTPFPSIATALPTECGHSAQICTVSKHKNPFDPDLYAFCSPNMSRLEIIQIVGGNGLVKASCFAHMIVSSPSRRPYLG